MPFSQAGWAISSYCQDLLPAIVVFSAKYKYFSAVDNKEVPQPVKMLQRKAAEFDIKSSEYYYDDEYDEYFISFIFPAGSPVLKQKAQGIAPFLCLIRKEQRKGK